MRPEEKGVEKFLGIQRGKHAIEGVMRGNAIGQLEERTKPVLLGWAYRRQDRRAPALLQSAIGIARTTINLGRARLEMDSSHFQIFGLLNESKHTSGMIRSDLQGLSRMGIHKYHPLYRIMRLVLWA